LYFQLPSWIGFAVLCAVAGAALLMGGWEERWASASLAANVVLTRVLRDQSWPHVQWTEFALDLLLLCALFAVALRSKKYWPLAAAAFALLSTLTHVANMADPHVVRWAYLTAILIWTYSLMITLGVGVYNHCRAERYRASAEAAPAPADTRR
jgi:hypothetical protein